MRRLVSAGRVACALLIAACGARPVSVASPTRDPEILWDNYGVPHIYAADRNGLAYAFGWAQMRNHGDLLLRLVAQARGRAAEYLGPSYLDEDRWVWRLDMPTRAEDWIALQTPETRAHTQAFVDGINAFAREHPELIGDSVRVVLPVKPADVLAHFQRVLYARFLTGYEQVRAQSQSWSERGSNAWAIAPKRSASGHTLLLQNPHLPWSDLFTWTEAQYTMPGVDVYGAALVLSPVLQIAFNDNLGWTHTVNTQDGADLYELTLSGDGYKWDGATRAFEQRTHVLRVRQPSGALRDDTLRTRWSTHGPVVADKPGKSLALAMVGIHGPPLATTIDQWWNMGKAKNLDEFLTAIRPNQISGQNITYGDRDGHIMVFYGGNSPVRSRGDRVYWAGVVPGDSSATLWSSLIPFDQIPKTLDPPSGWVQNANDPPWWATFPPQIRPDQFPAHIATRVMALRPQRSARMLDADSSITWDEFLADQRSTRMELADRVLDDLLPAALASTNETTHRAASILQSWDRSADTASRGAVLFIEWWADYVRRLPRGKSPYAVGWSERAPRVTPDGLADTSLALTALEAAAETVTKRYGSADVAWGTVYRVRRDGLDLPAPGASGEYGVFKVLNYGRENDGKFAAIGGTSYVGAVEFSSPVRAMTLVGYGNASRAGSPHRVDQLKLFAEKRYKPALLTRRDVESHLELREALHR